MPAPIFSPQHLVNRSAKKPLDLSNKDENDLLKDQIKLSKPKLPRRQFKYDYPFDDLGLSGFKSFQNSYKYENEQVQRQFEQKQQQKKSYISQILNTYDHHTKQNSLYLKQIKLKNQKFNQNINNQFNKLINKLNEKKISISQRKRQIQQLSIFLLPKVYKQKQKMQKQQKQQEKKLEQLNTLKKYKQQQIESKLQQKKRLDEKLQKVIQNYNNLYKKNQQIQKNIRQTQFQNAVNRIQIYHGYYRFGVNFYFKPEDRKLHFNENYVNWLEKKTRYISLVDLRCFILSCLYPKSSVIFDSIPTQSKLYYSMFDFKGELTEEQHKQHLNLIQEILRKFLTQRKITIHNFLKKTSNIRKKRIFLICESQKYQQRKAFIKDELLSFNNQLIKVQQVEQIQQFNQNGYTLTKITVRYEYANIQLSVVLQLYHFMIFDVKKKFFIEMAKQNNATDANYIWMEIPKYFLKQYYEEINGVYQMLKKIDNLSMIEEKN